MVYMSPELEHDGMGYNIKLCFYINNTHFTENCKILQRPFPHSYQLWAVKPVLPVYDVITEFQNKMHTLKYRSKSVNLLRKTAKILVN